MIRLLAPALIATAISAQTTIVVQGGGAALQQAIDAASPGDTLDVRAGSYDAVVVRKGITIDCRPGVTIGPTAWGPLVPFAVTVDAVPGHARCIVHGGTYQSFAVTGCAGTVVIDGAALTRAFVQGAYIDACTGPVVCQRIDCGNDYVRSERIEVRDSAQVSFTACRLLATRVTASNVSFADCEVPKRNQSVGLEIVTGSVAVRGGRYAGGNYFSWPIDLPGMSIASGKLVLTGGTIVEAETFWLQYYPNNPRAPAIDSSGGEIHIDPSVRLQSQRVPPIAGPATVVTRTVPTVEFVRQPANPAFRLTIAAEPGSLTMTAVGLPAPVVVLPFGELWLDPGSPVLDLALMPMTGTRALSGVLPPVPPYLALVLQSVSLPRAGGIVIGVPARIVLD